MAPKPGHPTLYDPKYCEELVTHMSKGYSFPSFAGKIRVCEDTLYEWAKVHPEFSEAKRIGKAMELFWWEGILRAGAGGRIAHYNATSTIFALKNKAPRHYRDRIHVEANHSMDDTKEQMHNLLQDDQYRAAALVIAEALAKKKHAEPTGE